MINCPIGNGRLEFKSESTVYTYKNHSMAVEQSGRYCTKCEETFLSPKDVELTQLKIANFKKMI